MHINFLPNLSLNQPTITDPMVQPKYTVDDIKAVSKKLRFHSSCNVGDKIVDVDITIPNINH